MNKTVIIIAGPTAAGKTSIAIHLAKYFDTDIISADSRQCYKELNIGVARPSHKELEEITHYFIADHSIHDKVTAATFETYALSIIEKLFRKKDIVIMVGGTGLYIRAFCEGMDEIPEVPELIRQEIKYEYDLKGITWLQEEVQRHDPTFYKEGEIKNPQRLMRALEVFKSTGKSILQYRKGKKEKRNFEIIKIAIDIPRDQLHNNINKRVDQMMEHGLEQEVHSLIPYQHLNALQTVGYKELFDYFNGEIPRVDAIQQIKRNTRLYAKRQLTWFKKDKDYTWLPTDPSIILVHLNQLLDQ